MGVHENIGAKEPRQEWTEERLEILTRMWGEGLPASHIARALGGVSRSAVIGKAYRVGLARRRAAFITQQAKNERMRRGDLSGGPGKGWRQTKPTRTPKQRDRVKLVGGTVFIQSNGHEPRAVPLSEAFQALPGSIAVPFLERPFGGCRWPIETEVEGEHLCCGLQIDPGHPSYCWTHRKVAGERTVSARDAREAKERRELLKAASRAA